MSAVTGVKRLSRTESQQRTRALIVDAATRLFLRDGFRATSLEQVAQAAGFTIGAVYSNFESKTAVGIEVIDGLYAREERRLTRALERVPHGDRQRFFAALAKWADSTIGDVEWTRLEVELAAESAHDPRHRVATAQRHAWLRARCHELIEEHLDVAGSPLAPDTLGTVIVGLALGIGTQRAVDPSIPGSAWSEALEALVR